MPSITSNTVVSIITEAMHEAGLLQEGDEPSSYNLARYSGRLNDLINLWQTQGLKLFLNSEETVPLIAGTNTYEFFALGQTPQKDVVRVIQGRIVDSQGTYRPIYPVSWDEWNRLSQPADGAIVNYFVDKQTDKLVVKVWNTPDTQEATNTMVLLMQRQAVNPINLEEDVGFPQEWKLALLWGLADQIAGGQPQAIMDRCEAKAKQYREALEDWDVEDAPTTFAPDYRFQNSGYATSGNFR